MRRLVQAVLVSVVVALAGGWTCVALAWDLPGAVMDKPEYLLYLPDTLEAGRRYPVIVAFSAGANADGLMRTWNEHARNRRCALFCSKVVRNGMDVPPVLKRIAKQIGELAQEHPIDPSWAIGTGVSGGGMTAHLFSFLYPRVVAAVISNVGYIHENSLKKVKTYPRRKICAFLTSPTDFNYPLMKEDKKFLDRLEWETRWWEFEGGHRTAPAEINDEALGWVIENLPAGSVVAPVAVPQAAPAEPVAPSAEPTVAPTGIGQEGSTSTESE